VSCHCNLRAKSVISVQGRGAMTREERTKAVQEMDAIIERAERACQSYQLSQMEMMAALARAKAIHKQLIAKKAELQRELEE
jgi:hypothetical protein